MAQCKPLYWILCLYALAVRLPFITVHVSLQELWRKSFAFLASAFPPPEATTTASGQAIHSFGSPLRSLFAYRHFWIILCLRGLNFIKHTKSFFRVYDAWYTIWSLTLICTMLKSSALTSQETQCVPIVKFSWVVLFEKIAVYHGSHIRIKNSVPVPQKTHRLQYKAQPVIAVSRNHYLL